MAEKTFTIENLNPSRFFGPHNRFFKQFKAKYPELTVTARGEKIKAKGAAKSLAEFELAMNSILTYLQGNTDINLEDLDRIAEGTETKESKTTEVILHGPKGKVIYARTKNQKRMVSGIASNDILFAIGPAGTGKTYTAVALAVKALKNKQVKRIILARPAVEAGESLGFLPGDLKEKIDPYLRPLYDALNDMIPFERYTKFIQNGTIEIAPMAFMRGRTLDDCFVILDEAQNATDVQLKMFLTRMGPSAKVIITGDLSQIDLPAKQKSGLAKAIGLLADINGIKIIELDEEDVVRHRLVKEIIKAYKQGG